jgi:hypothetical protein
MLCHEYTLVYSLIELLNILMIAYVLTQNC